MQRPAFLDLAENLAKTSGPMDTVVVAFANLNSGEMARVLANPSGPALAYLARALLVEALEMMEEASDDPSMELANNIEAAIALLPAFDGEDEAEHL
jgi:hypothetical protein